MRPAVATDDARTATTKHHLRIIAQFPFDDSVTQTTLPRCDIDVARRRLPERTRPQRSG
jgi:hypothetical protein